MAEEVVLINRYPNRRFYDRSQRRHVTLGEIEEMVRGGRTVEVRDTKTGEDLTRQVLTQILLERHPDKMELFPSTLLHGLLRANDLATGIWQAYLRHSLSALEGLQRSVTPMGSPLPWISALMPVFTEGGKPGSTDEERLRTRLEDLDRRIGRLESSPEPSGAVEGAEAVERLERRVKGLERKSGR